MKNVACVNIFNYKDPFREAKLIASDAVRALGSIDYTSDPPLNVPDKYKHMIWFTLPIDIALMMTKSNDNEHESMCNLNTLPFIPDDAKVNADHIQ
jgi:hypothetical protein